MTGITVMGLTHSIITGTLPREWSSMTGITWMWLSDNIITGTLPQEWSSMTGVTWMDLSTNSISGTLPREWSNMTSIIRMDLSTNSITGTLPSVWRSLISLEEIALDNNGITGSLLYEWSHMTSMTSLTLSRNRLSGTLPESWSKMANMNRMILSANKLSGELPESWSSMTNLVIMTLDSNKLSGTIPKQWFDSALAIRKRELPHQCRYSRLHGGLCYADYRLNSTFATRLSISSNQIIGKVNHSEGQVSCDGKRIDISHLADSLNCIMNSEKGHQQRFCPSPALPWHLTATLVGVLLGGAVAALCARRTIGAPTTLPKGGLGRVRLASFLTKSRRAINAAPIWLIAALAAMLWNVFIVSPTFEDQVINSLKNSGTSDQMVVMARNLSATLQPVAWGIVFLWNGANNVRGYWESSGPAAWSSTWTLIASLDGLEENLATVCTDQAILAGLFTILVPLVSLLNLAAIPSFFSRWVPVQAPFHVVLLNMKSEPPVWMEVEVEVPAKLVALLTASLLIVLYHAVACISLPGGVLTSRAIGEACTPAAWAQAESEGHRQPLKSLFWLRQGGWALMASAIVATIGLTSAVALMETPDLTGFDYYRDWRPYKDKEAEGRYEPVKVLLGTAYVWAAGFALGAQVVVSAVWLWSVLGWSFFNLSGQSMDDPNVGKTKWNTTLWNRLVSSRGHAQRSLCLLIIGLQMIPVLGAGHFLGSLLVGVTWGLSCLLLAAALLVHEGAATFEDLKGSPGYGLVIDAGDLAAALAANLAEGDTGGAASSQTTAAVRRLSCCTGDGHAAGCGKCQRLLRRFPATSARMQEALAVSYRWQPQPEALVHPGGNSGPADIVGLKDGVVGINMSRWQREQLLRAVEESALPYVWLDALSIPAGVLGRSPDPDFWLTGVSGTLLTRMMAVYAAAAKTLVLKSAELPGARYHQRAWTMQEYCGSRAVAEHSEAPQGERMSSTAEEDLEFEGLRDNIRTRMRCTLPLWVLRIAEERGSPAEPSLREAQLWGIEAYAKAQAQVECLEPVDRVRALLPIFLNSPVQDAPELLDLTRRGLRLAEERRLAEDVKAAMATAVDLVSRTVGQNQGQSISVVIGPPQPPLLTSFTSGARHHRASRQIELTRPLLDHGSDRRDYSGNPSTWPASARGYWHFFGRDNMMVSVWRFLNGRFGSTHLPREEEEEAYGFSSY